VEGEREVVRALREGRARVGDAQRSSTRPRYLRDGQSSESVLARAPKEGEGEGRTVAATNDAPAAVRPKVALVADAHELCGPDVRVADRAVGASGGEPREEGRRRERKGRGQLGALRRELGGGRGRGRTTCRRTFRTCGRWLFRVQDEDEEREEGCVSSRARGGPRREE